MCNHSTIVHSKFPVYYCKVNSINYSSYFMKLLMFHFSWHCSVIELHCILLRSVLFAPVVVSVSKNHTLDYKDWHSEFWMEAMNIGHPILYIIWMMLSYILSPVLLIPWLAATLTVYCTWMVHYTHWTKITTIWARGVIGKCDKTA